MIDIERRKALKTGGGLGLLGVLAATGLVSAKNALAKKNVLAFEAKTMDEALDALGAILPPNSAAIQITAPETAENGAFVPVTISSTIPRTDQIFVFVDRNPTMLAARFVFPEGTEGFITTRIKMNETSKVIALVKADGKFYRAAREVKVVLGGCS